MQFKAGVKRADRSNAIDLYVTDQISDREDFDALFENTPPPLTPQAKKDWKAKMKGFVVSSDAFFPFHDNVQRAAQSGVQYLAAPSGSVNDSGVVAEANKQGMTLVFTEHRLFHH